METRDLAFIIRCKLKSFFSVFGPLFGLYNSAPAYRTRICKHSYNIAGTVWQGKKDCLVYALTGSHR